MDRRESFIRNPRLGLLIATCAGLVACVQIQAPTPINTGSVPQGPRSPEKNLGLRVFTAAGVSLSGGQVFLDRQFKFAQSAYLGIGEVQFSLSGGAWHADTVLLGCGINVPSAFMEAGLGTHAQQPAILIYQSDSAGHITPTGDALGFLQDNPPGAGAAAAVVFPEVDVIDAVKDPSLNPFPIFSATPEVDGSGNRPLAGTIWFGYDLIASRSPASDVLHDLFQRFILTHELTHLLTGLRHQAIGDWFYFISYISEPGDLGITWNGDPTHPRASDQGSPPAFQNASQAIPVRTIAGTSSSQCDAARSNPYFLQ